jgi:hypothetical protein
MGVDTGLDFYRKHGTLPSKVLRINKTIVNV